MTRYQVNATVTPKQFYVDAKSFEEAYVKACKDIVEIKIVVRESSGIERPKE